MPTDEPLIVVYLVTYRRHAMLRRALASVLAQSYRRLLVKVVNDDPEDPQVATIIAEANDPRATLFEPVQKRGATRSFNLMFEDAEADLVSLLEDDNWWEPTFLEEMSAALARHPDHRLVVGNERIWRQEADGRWTDTEATIWPFRDLRTHLYSLEDISGSAKLCNSAMLVRVAAGGDLRTPQTVPVDVTEHFRERLFERRLLLNGAPLVNYAETLQTARSTRGEAWGAYQQLLIGSLFAATQDAVARGLMAKRLWADCAAPNSPRAVSLVATGFAVAEARDLVRKAPLSAIVRFLAWIVRRPARLAALSSVRRDHQLELSFLVDAPLTRQVVRDVA